MNQEIHKFDFAYSSYLRCQQYNWDTALSFHQVLLKEDLLICCYNKISFCQDLQNNPLILLPTNKLNYWFFNNCWIKEAASSLSITSSCPHSYASIPSSSLLPTESSSSYSSTSCGKWNRLPSDSDTSESQSDICHNPYQILSLSRASWQKSLQTVLQWHRTHLYLNNTLWHNTLLLKFFN